MTYRSEVEIVADTLLALNLDGFVTGVHLIEARTCVGITYDDMQAAQRRRPENGFVAPIRPPEKTEAKRRRS